MEKLTEEQFTEIPVKKDENEEKLLVNAIKNTTISFLEYYNANKHKFTKNELFHVLMAAAIYPVVVDFEDEVKSYLYDPETASEEQKNLMAFTTHLFDINMNLRLRQIVAEVAATEIKGDSNE